MMLRIHIRLRKLKLSIRFAIVTDSPCVQVRVNADQCDPATAFRTRLNLLNLSFLWQQAHLPSYADSSAFHGPCHLC